MGVLITNISTRIIVALVTLSVLICRFHCTIVTRDHSLFAAKRISPVGRLLVVIVGGTDLTPGENGRTLVGVVVTLSGCNSEWHGTGNGRKLYHFL